MNILFIGDIVGKVGRKALVDNLNTIKRNITYLLLLLMVRIFQEDEESTVIIMIF